MTGTHRANLSALKEETWLHLRCRGVKRATSAPWLSQLCLSRDDSIQIMQPLPRHAQPSEGELLDSAGLCCFQRGSHSPKAPIILTGTRERKTMHLFPGVISLSPKSPTLRNSTLGEKSSVDNGEVKTHGKVGIRRGSKGTDTVGGGTLSRWK